MVAVSHAHSKTNLAVAKERSAKTVLCKEAYALDIALIYYMYYEQASKQQAKYGPPALLRVFFIIQEI